ncbi:bifunctional hydroxymethylpyrimidine kinase/phosphomethylpyrimidine kinase, partial [Sphingomonas sp. FUKUSWIS1]
TNPRIETRHAHGTGCTLASGIATGLGQGMPLDAAIARAIAFVRAALAQPPGLGAGHGPMGHALGVSPFDQLKDRTCPA